MGGVGSGRRKGSQSRGLGVQISGEKEVLKALMNAGKTEIEALAAAIYQEGTSIMNKSEDMCPVDERFLRDSRYVAPPTMGDNSPEVEIGYGKDYAVYVHEMPEQGINWTKSGTGSKYLEKPVNEAKSGYASRVAKRQKKNFKKGVGMNIGKGEHPKRPRDNGSK